MRAVTRTTLTLGDLLEIPIGIAAATGSQEVKFDTASADGAGRVQLYVHPTKHDTFFDLVDHEAGVEGVHGPDDLRPVEVPHPIEADETVKGLRVGGQLRQVPESEIQAARDSTKMPSVEVLEFVDYRKVPTDRLHGSFYVQPDPGFAKPLRTLMEAMRRDGRAMVVKYSVRDRQRLGVIRVRRTSGGDVLLLNDVAFADTWREPDANVLEPAHVEAVDDRAVEHAQALIADLAGDGKSLEAARDDLYPALSEIVERAHMGVYDDPAKVAELAGTYYDAGLTVRGDELLEWARTRFPDDYDEAKYAEALRIVESGEDVGDRLAALVG